MGNRYSKHNPHSCAVGLFIAFNVGNMVGKTFIDKQKGTEEIPQSLSITMASPTRFELVSPA